MTIFIITMEARFLKSYCIIGLNSIEELKEDLNIISETNVNLVGGKYMLIATFKSAFNVLEIEELLNMSNKSYLLFELTPGFYAVNLQDKEFQEALFGNDNNKLPFTSIEEALKKIKDGIFDEITNYSEKTFKGKSIEEQLKEALDNEDYESAAKLRDQIKRK